MLDTQVMNPLDSISDSEIESVLLDRPIRSLYDIAYTYGNLRVLADMVEVDSDLVRSEYVSYMTPASQVDSYFGDEAGLVSVCVVWDSDSETFEYAGLDVEELTFEKTVRAGYCRPKNKSGRMIAHSLCQLTSSTGYDVESVAGKLQDRFTRWPTDSSVVSGTEGHEDVWIVEGLAEFGDSVCTDSWVDDVADELRTELEGQFPYKGLQSVKLKIDGEWYYPGELDVINEGMVQKKKDRLADYSDSNGSVGDGVCYVTGEETEVFGSSPSPVNFFGVKQAGSYFGLNHNYTWEERPLSSDAAMSVAKGSSAINSFVTAQGADNRVLYVPYYERLSADKVRDMYQQYLQMKVIGEDDSSVDVLSSWMHWQDGPDPSGRRLYGVYYKQDQAALNVLHNESKAISKPYISSLKEAHQRVLRRTGWFGKWSDKIGYRDWNTWVFDMESQFEPVVLSGTFWRDVTEQYRDSVREDQSWNVMDATMDLLAGEPTRAGTLYDRYVTRIIQSQDVSSEYPIPTLDIWAAYVHFELLSEAGLVTNVESNEVSKGLISFGDNMGYMVADRSEKLELFIESHPNLDDDVHRGAFLLGALVGRMSQYQTHSRGLSKTVVSDYPVESLTASRFQQMFHELVDKVLSYTESDDGDTLFFNRFISPLTEIAPAYDPQSASTSKMRYYYAIGLAYGYDDVPIKTYDDDENTSDTPESAPEVTEDVESAVSEALN